MNPETGALSIVHVTDGFYPETGGVERVVLNLARWQIRAKHRVVVLTKGLPGSLDHEVIEGIDVRRYPHREKPTPRNYLSSYYGAKTAFHDILKQGNVDLLHCHLTLSSQGPISVAKKHKLPVVVGFYGPWDREFREEAKPLLARSGAAYRLYLESQMAAQCRLQRRMLRHADKVIVLSDFSVTEADRIQAGIRRKTTKIPGGVQADRFFPNRNDTSFRLEYGIATDAFLVLTVRRLAHRMGVDLLIDAVASCLQKQKDCRLIIGGTGPSESELKRKVRDAGLQDRVVFAGFIPEQTLPAAYNAADLFVMPSRAQENFGLPILEAAACATPVVGTPVGSIFEVLGGIDPTLLAASATSEALADRIEHVMDNREEISQRFLLTARQVAATYDWDTVARQVQAVYREVLA